MKRTNKLGLLKRKADKLYQIKYIPEKPYSLVSGRPTEVLHHFIPKSQSSNLRYDPKNGIPLTNAEHFAHHTVGDPTILMAIEKNLGKDTVDYLQEARRMICTLNIGYMNVIIERLQ